jgi:hypothetical protein
MFKKIISWILLIVIPVTLIIGIIAVVELYCGYSYFKYRDTLKNELNAIRLREPFHNQNNPGLHHGEEFLFRTDSEGYILPYRNIDSSSHTVAFIGGSTTECRVVDENIRVHRSVERILNAKGKRVTCLNIGNSGNHSMHSLNILANKVMKHSPKVVVVNHNVNDLSILLNTGTYFNKHPQRSLLLENSESLYAYKVGLPKNKFIRTFIPYISLVLLPTTFDGERLIEQDEFPSGPISFDLTKQFLKNEFRKSITGLIAYAKAWQVKPILMTQGSCFSYGIKNIDRYDGYDLVLLHQEFNKVIREVAIREEVELVDAELLMKGNKAYFFDSVHYTDSGSVFISKYISKSIQKLIEN